MRWRQAYLTGRFLLYDFRLYKLYRLYGLQRLISHPQ
jgi:hypothetical protein